MKISFDFDYTLSRPYIQRYAVSLLSRGHNIFIVTSRRKDSYKCPVYGCYYNITNSDLFNVADQIGINRDNIFFTSTEYKSPIIKMEGIKIHFDDDDYELNEINKKTNAVGISVWTSSGFIKKSERIIKTIENKMKNSMEK